MSIHSGAQIAETLQQMGIDLIEQTPTGQWAMSDRIMRRIMAETDSTQVQELLHAVLLAKQLLKRRESYTEAFLREMDSEGRVHPSINSLAARTARMSVSNPPLQQLPTKDRESDNV
jgi:DNA polymerase-1